LEDEAGGWRRAGLDVVVSLLEESEAAQLDLENEDGAARSNRIRFVSFPVPDRGAPASTRDALALLRTIREELEAGRNVAVHCRQGIGRSGLIAAGVLVTSGVPAAKALEVVSSARGQIVPETPAQVAWIRQLPADRLVEAV
jgi:protein-tyrosine phosphatase